jgi:hypothetical protein
MTKNCRCACAAACFGRDRHDHIAFYFTTPQEAETFARRFGGEHVTRGTM